MQKNTGQSDNIDSCLEFNTSSLIDFLTEYTGTQEENWYKVEGEDNETVFLNSQDKMEATFIFRTPTNYDFSVSSIQLH